MGVTFIIILLLIFCFVPCAVLSLTAARSQQSGNNSSANSRCGTIEYVAAIPADRTLCNNFGSKLLPEEVLGERADFLSATMRIRNGIFKQSRARKGISPIFVAVESVNITTTADSRGAYSIGASLAYTLHDSDAPMAKDFLDAAFWKKVMPSISVRRQPFGSNANPADGSNEADEARLNIISPQSFIRSLKKVGLEVHVEHARSSIINVAEELASGRIPVVLMAGCRRFNFSSSSSGSSSSATRPWPLVWGDPFEKYAIVVGVDLELVYLIVDPSSLASAAVAMKRTEFLERWHHSAYWKNEHNGEETFFPVQRWMASVFRPVANETHVHDDSLSLFAGALEMLDRPPEVVELDDVC